MVSKAAKQLLLGMSIGDGHVRKEKRELTFKHCIKQAPYVEAKKVLLEKVLNKKINCHYKTECRYPYAYIDVHCKHLKYVRKWIYKGGEKKLPINVLRRLSDQSIAIWYMDDGSLYPRKHNGKIRSYELTISTYLKTHEEAQIICNFFKERYNVGMTVKKHKGRFSVRCGKTEAVKLLVKLKPYQMPSMEYKFKLVN